MCRLGRCDEPCAEPEAAPPAEVPEPAAETFIVICVPLSRAKLRRLEVRVALVALLEELVSVTPGRCWTGIAVPLSPAMACSPVVVLPMTAAPIG